MAYDVSHPLTTSAYSTRHALILQMDLDNIIHHSLFTKHCRTFTAFTTTSELAREISECQHNEFNNEIFTL